MSVCVKKGGVKEGKRGGEESGGGEGKMVGKNANLFKDGERLEALREHEQLLACNEWQWTLLK